MTVRDPRDVVVSALLFRPLITKVLARLGGAALARGARHPLREAGRSVRRLRTQSAR